MKETSTIPHTPSIGRQSQTTETERAAIYIRCSSDEAKKEGYSPKTQERIAREFIQRNKWEFDEKHIYNKDIGVSGGTDERKEFQRLMKDARNGEFDVIVVLRLDRVFRDAR